jgi:pyruvate/2-oxoglutarate dehydrogenase complex dihydrolipoamide acyltransferase (E2) component
MKDRAKDVLKTVGAVLIIGGIVVATFLYGNKQRQEQLRRDQQAQEQANQTATQQPAPAPAPAPAPQPQPTPAPNLPGGVGGGQVPAAGASLPETGAGLLYGIGATATVLAYGAHRRSRKALLQAQL